MRHFLNLAELAAQDLRAMVDEAKTRKQARAGWPKGRVDADKPLADHVGILFFAQPSTRTRISFALAFRQLGGEAVILGGTEAQWSRGESVEDMASTLSRYGDMLAARMDDHALLEQMAKASSVPVINALTRQGHPCQILADILTIEEQLGAIAGKTLCWAGDGNNMLCSWLEAAPAFGFTLHAAVPPEDLPQHGFIKQGLDAGWLKLFSSAKEAASGADCVMTDVWSSMGDEGGAQAKAKRQRLAALQVNQEVMDAAKQQAIFLHCLPAHRGEEVAPQVIDGAASHVFDAAENRLHSQKAILLWVAGKLR